MVASNFDCGCAQSLINREQLGEHSVPLSGLDQWDEISLTFSRHLVRLLLLPG